MSFTYYLLSFPLFVSLPPVPFIEIYFDSQFNKHTTCVRACKSNWQLCIIHRQIPTQQIIRLYSPFNKPNMISPNKVWLLQLPRLQILITTASSVVNWSRNKELTLSSDSRAMITCVHQPVLKWKSFVQYQTRLDSSFVITSLLAVATWLRWGPLLTRKSHMSCQFETHQKKGITFSNGSTLRARNRNPSSSRPVSN